MSMQLRIVVGLAVLVAIIGLAWIVVELPDGRRPLRNEARTVNFGQTVANGVSLRKHGFYGIDFVRCGSCRIEKRKIGALTMGGFNVLILKDLDLVIPSSEKVGNCPEVSEPEAMKFARRLGVTGDTLNLGRRSLKFSGLHVENLRLATLDAQTNVCPCLVAKSGDAERDGLHLRGCMIVRGGATNAVGRAVLRVKPDLRLTWADGELKI